MTSWGLKYYIRCLLIVGNFSFYAPKILKYEWFLFFGWSHMWMKVYMLKINRGGWWVSYGCEVDKVDCFMSLLGTKYLPC